MDRKFLNNRICQQLRGELGNPLLRRWLTELDLEPLALAHAGYLAEPKPPASPGDCLALRIMDLGLEHHVNDESGHVPNSTRAGACARG